MQKRALVLTKARFHKSGDDIAVPLQFPIKHAYNKFSRIKVIPKKKTGTV